MLSTCSVFFYNLTRIFLDHGSNIMRQFLQQAFHILQTRTGPRSQSWWRSVAVTASSAPGPRFASKEHEAHVRGRGELHLHSVFTRGHGGLTR